MLVDLTRPGYVTVRKEVSDPKFGKDESWFYYRLKVALRRLGKDCIKKPAYKDGHLVGNSLLYIRDRTHRWCVYDSDYCIRSVSQDFDTLGEVRLSVFEETKGVFYETASQSV